MPSASVAGFSSNEIFNATAAHVTVDDEGVGAEVEAIQASRDTADSETKVRRAGPPAMDPKPRPGRGAGPAVGDESVGTRPEPGWYSDPPGAIPAAC